MGDNLKLLAGVLIGASLALLLTGTFSGGGMMGGFTMGGGVLGMLFALVFWVAVLALIVAFAAWAVRRVQRR